MALSPTPISISEKVDSLLEKHVSLRNLVETIIFPDHNHPAFVKLRDTKKWPKWRSRLYHWSNSSILFCSDENNLYRNLRIFLFWLIMFGAWSALAYVFFEVIFGSTVSTNEPVQIPWYGYFYLAVFLISIPLSFATYYHIIDFLFNDRNSWKARLLWIVAFIIATGYLIFTLKITYPSTFPNVLLDNNRLVVFFVLATILFALPAVIYSTSLLILSFLFGVWLVNFIFEYFISSSNPFTEKAVQKVLAEYIICRNDRWKLSDLSIDELRAIRELSKDNLAANEKRLTPTFWLLALLGLFFNTYLFEDWLSGWTTYFSEKFIELMARESLFVTPLDVIFLFLILTPIVLTIFTIILGMYITIFRNLTVQTIIIDSCTVSIFELEQKEKEANQEAIKKVNSQKNWFWKKLFG